MAICGGLLGLFLGVSVLSLFEIIFHATLRLFWRIKHLQAITDAESNGDIPNVENIEDNEDDDCNVENIEDNEDDDCNGTDVKHEDTENETHETSYLEVISIHSNE